jgi:uncharacterized protein (TIGR03067 family)
MTPTLLLGLILTVGAPAPKETAKPTPKLEGDWVVESFDAPEKGPPGTITFTITADRILINSGGRDKPDDAAYSADLTKKPATIDIRPNRAGGPGGPPPPDLVVKGILSIDGDTLKLCFTRDGERPTEFKADADKRTVLITLKRAKPEK